MFFLIQQFITWSMKADHGSYFVTVYKQTQTTWNRKKKKKRKRKENYKLNVQRKMIKQKLTHDE